MRKIPAGKTYALYNNYYNEGINEDNMMKKTGKKSIRIFAAAMALLFLVSYANLFVFTVGAADNIVSIQSVSLPSSVASGGIFDGSVTVTNNSGSDQSGLKIKAKVSNTSAISVLSFDSVDSGTLKAGETKTFDFSFKAVSSESTVCDVKFTVETGSDTVLSERKASINISAAAGQSDETYVARGIELLAKTALPSVLQGNEYKINLRLANMDEARSNITVTATPPKGFEANGLTTVGYGNLREGQVFEPNFSFNVTGEAKVGQNQITIQVFSDGKPLYTDYITVNVQKNDDLSSLKSGVSISNITIPETAEKGSDVKISLTLSNSGKKTGGIKVEIKPTAATEIVNKSSTIVTIDSLDANAEKNIDFTFYINKDAASNYKTFEITVTENYSSETPDFFKQYTGFNVVSAEELFDISIDVKESVAAGEKFTVKVSVTNRGADASGVDLNVALPSSGEIINTSAKSFKIDSIKKGETVTKEISCTALESAKSAFNTIQVTLTGGSLTVEQYGGTYVSAKGETDSPSFDIKIDAPEKVTAGEKFNVKITVKNNGGEAADYVMDISLPSDIVNTSANTFKISLKRGETVAKEISCTALDTAKSYYNPIKVSIAKGQDLTEQYSGVYISALGDKNKPQLIIESVEIPATVGIETDFYVKVTLKNEGLTAQNVKLTLTAGTGFANKSNNIAQIKELKSGETVTKTFMFMANKTASNGFNSITIDAEYEGGADSKVSFYSGLNVSNPEKEKEAENNNDAPVIMIERFDYGGDSVMGGKVFTFEVELKNTHHTKDIRDLKITITQDKGIFNPKKGSNTFFVEVLGPGETVTKKIDLIVKADTIPDSYGLLVTMTYKGGVTTEKTDSLLQSAANLTATETINIPVTQEMRFNIGEMPPIDPLNSIREEASLFVQFGNLGKSKIYNVVVKVQGEGFRNSEGECYAGDIEPGTHQSKEFYLAPNQAGMITGQVLFSYENADGEVTTETRDFNFVVNDEGGMNGMSNGMDGMVQQMPGTEGMDGGREITGYDEMGNPIFAEDPSLLEEAKFWSFNNMTAIKWVVFIAIGLVPVIIIIIIIVAVRSKKKKKLLLDDEDDEDMLD